MGKKAPSLDSLGDLYPGFVVHKMMLRAWRADADGLWERAFLRLSRTTAFYQRSDRDIAVGTMKALLEAMPRGKRKKLRRSAMKRYRF